MRSRSARSSDSSATNRRALAHTARCVRTARRPIPAARASAPGPLFVLIGTFGVVVVLILVAGRRPVRGQLTVTVRWTDDDGRTRTSSDTVYARAADAPVVGGTVLVWSVGERAADHYLEPDPESERDPLSAVRYQRPAS